MDEQPNAFDDTFLRRCRRNRKEFRKLIRGKIEYCQKLISTCDSADNITEQHLCILISLHPSELEKIGQHLKPTMPTIHGYTYSFELKVMEYICRLFISHNVVLLPLLGHDWWNDGYIWADNTGVQEHIQTHINIPTAESHLDKIDKLCFLDVNTAIILIGLRKYRKCHLLSLCPREVILVIAKMLHLKSLENAWNWMRDSIEKEKRAGYKRWEETLY
jgi:hypothetical protein